MSDLINVQASTAHLFFNKSSTEMEEFMRDFVSPVHCKHAFNVMIKQLGPRRPEVTLLAEFVRLTRRSYSHAKLLKLRMINKDGLFTRDDLKRSVNDLQNFMFLLDQSYNKMSEFCDNLPPLFQTPNLSRFVGLLLDYFEPGTGQHKEFTDILDMLLDQAVEVLSKFDSKHEKNGDPNNVLQGSQDNVGGASGGERQTVTFHDDNKLDSHSEPEQWRARVQQPGTVPPAFSQHNTRTTHQTGFTGDDPKVNAKVTGPLPNSRSAVLRTSAVTRLEIAVRGLETAVQSTHLADGDRLGTDHLSTPGWGGGDETFSRKGLENFTKILPGRSVIDDFSKNIPNRSRVVIANMASNVSNIGNMGNIGNVGNVSSNTWSYHTDQPPNQSYHTGQQQSQTTHPPTNTSHTSSPSHKDPVTTSEIVNIEPKISQLELRNLVIGIKQLKDKICALDEHVSSLSEPNESTNDTLETYIKKVGILKDKSSTLFDRFGDKIDETTQIIMERIFMDASSLRTILEQLHPKCSTALTIPHVNASLLKSVKVPRLNVTRFVSPGFFCQAKDILDHISRNPFQMKYYVSLGYDRNRIIRPEPEPEPEFRFRLAGTGSEFSNSGSGMKNRNKHFEIPVPVQKNRN